MTLLRSGSPTNSPLISLAQHDYRRESCEELVTTGEQPPSYDSEINSMSVADGHFNCVPPSNEATDVDYRKYDLVKSVLSEDKTTITCYNEWVLGNATALARLVNDQLVLPPKPTIRIRGTYGESWGEEKVDFDLMFNLTSRIFREGPKTVPAVHIMRRVHPPSYQASDKKKTDVDVGIQGLVEGFCAGATICESFVLERQVATWDMYYLEKSIRELVGATRYSGKVSVTFPIEYSKVVVTGRPAVPTQSNSKSFWYGTVATVRDPIPEHAVVTSIWPSPFEKSSNPGLTTPEQAWLHVWKIAMLNAVLSKRRGWVTHEDLADATAGFRASHRTASWGGWSDWCYGKC